jgi:hypothetical protein
VHPNSSCSTSSNAVNFLASVVPAPCPVVMNEHVDHADGMFYCKAKETYTSKGAVNCPPLPFDIPINPKERQRVKVLSKEYTLCCCQGDSQCCQVISYSWPEFEPIRHPSQSSGEVSITHPIDP